MKGGYVMKRTILILISLLLLLSSACIVRAAESNNVENPEIYFYCEKPIVENYINEAVNDYFGDVILRGEIRNCENLEKCEIAIRYDPWVLESKGEYLPEWLELNPENFICSESSPRWVERNVYEIIVEISRVHEDIVIDLSNTSISQAALQKSTSADEPAADVLHFFPRKFFVRNSGATNLQITVLSWTDTKGNTINGNVIVDDGLKTAMSKEEHSAMVINPKCLRIEMYTGIWGADAGLTVGQVKAAATDFAEVAILDKEQTHELADDELIATGCYYTVQKNGVRYFSRELLVKNDINGDGLVSSDDARLALRMSVGLEPTTDLQCYAVGVSPVSGLNSAVARTLLRVAVGLPA